MTVCACACGASGQWLSGSGAGLSGAASPLWCFLDLLFTVYCLNTPDFLILCAPKRYQKGSLTRSSLLPAGGRHTLPPYRGGSTVPEEYTNQRPPCAPPRLFAPPPRGIEGGGGHRGCAPGDGEASFEVCALVARIRTESPRGLPGRIMSVYASVMFQGA